MRRLPLLLITLLAACSDPAPSAPPAPTAPPSFINKVWSVSASPTVAPGTLYVFLSEGTLVITRTGDKPMTGTWTRAADGAITMVEEGLSYRTEILSLTETELRLRSHNPGEPVEITLSPAAP